MIFVCFERRIIIEVDGGQHAEEIAEQDRKRDEWFKAQGYTVLRFWNNDVLENRDAVLDMIQEYCHPPLAPPI